MIGIAGDVASVAAFYFANGVRKAIPDGFALAVFVPGAFDLIRSRGGTPEKVFRKLKWSERRWGSEEFAEKTMARRVDGKTSGGAKGSAKEIAPRKRAKLPNVHSKPPKLIVILLAIIGFLPEGIVHQEEREWHRQ